MLVVAELGMFVAWPGLPGPGLLSPSGVSAGGVGMLMMAVVIWAALQFGLSPSSDFMLRLERLENKFSAWLVFQNEVVERMGMVVVLNQDLIQLKYSKTPLKRPPLFLQGTIYVYTDYTKLR